LVRISADRKRWSAIDAEVNSIGQSAHKGERHRLAA
jgi:hypothetical protein